MISAIILAGGNSTRMNGINKQFAEIDGIPVLAMSVMKFVQSPLVGEIIVAASAENMAQCEQLCTRYGGEKLKAVTQGGATRFLSVKNALEQVSPQADFIAIHDGARPLVETADIDRVIADAVKYGAAIAAARAVDTVKTADADGFVESTPPRQSLWYAQTPQVFSKALYLSCLERLGSRAEDATDDSRIAEQCGVRVHLTEITSCNMKITHPDDLAAANAVYLNRKAERL